VLLRTEIAMVAAKRSLLFMMCLSIQFV
jgi:hypothetical protein